jgi:hypothetical protein
MTYSSFWRSAITPSEVFAACEARDCSGTTSVGDGLCRNFKWSVEAATRGNSPFSG